MASIFYHLVMLYFAQLVCPFYLSTMKYLVTYAPSFSVHILESISLKPFSFLKLCSVMFQK